MSRRGQGNGVEGESGGRDDWNWGLLSRWCGDRVQSTLPGI